MRVYASAEMTLTDTNDGISVTGIDRYYMASSSSSGVTVGSQGWMPDPQETNPISRYHWSYEVVNYSDGAKIPSKPAVIGVYGKEGVDAVTVSLSSEAHTFAGTESKAIASSLSIDISAFKGNQRIPTSIGTVTGGISGQLTHSELGRGTTNNKLVINATSALAKGNGTLSIPIVADGRTFNKVFSWSVAFKGIPGDKGDTGDKGDKGDKGDTGDKGATGTGIKSSEISYVIHTNGTTAPTLGWVSTVPSPVKGRYLWTRTITTYTDNTTSTTYSVAYQATDGQQGDTGATGTGVSSTAVTYAQTTSGTTTPTSWSATRPAPIKGQYLWSRTIITYTNGSSSTAYNTSYSATDGQKGDKGDTGPQGPQGIKGPSGSNGTSQWVHIRYSANSNGSSMTSSPSSTTKYVGIAVTNSATAPAYTGFTWSKYVGEDGSRGPQGLPGQKGDDGTTTYTWIRYADTPTSGMNQYPDGKKYIGLAFNKTTQTESSNYSDYKWSLMPQNIEIGGRNLVLNSSALEASGLGAASGTRAEYQTINTGQSYMDLEDGEIITVSFDIEMKVATANPYLMVYNTNRPGPVGIPSVTVSDQLQGAVGETINKRISFTTHATLRDSPSYSDNTLEFYSTYDSDNFYKISKLKVERGNVATDWTPAPEDVQAEIDDKASAEDLTDVSNDLNTSIGDLSNTVDGKVDKSLYEEFLEHNANIQEQLSTSTANAQEDITKALARTATVEQKLGEGAADWIFTHTQIRMSDEGITLGEQGSGSYLQITNDQISFYNGSEDPVAFINGGMLNINHAIFVESIQISEFMFSSEAPGHLTLRYVGK